MIKESRLEWEVLSVSKQLRELFLRDSSAVFDAEEREVLWLAEGYCFLQLTFPCVDSLRETSKQAYLKVCQKASQLEMFLLRCWHFIPRINNLEDGVERYQLFCSGRYEGLIDSGFMELNSLPAASAVGTDSSELKMFFFLGKEKGASLENPNQISAFRYPKQYGIHSPSFARAYEVAGYLLISGTASIVGSESQHVGALTRQLTETKKRLVELYGERKPLYLTAYVRHEEDIMEVESYVNRNFPTVKLAQVMKAEVCRRELLVEIELIAK